jgi:Cu/Ag efflux pump CusA
MQNYRNLLLVLANLPFALVGGIFVALATGASRSLGSLVGFVTLFGITSAARNPRSPLRRAPHLALDGLGT